jgi:hypothetical protein
MDSTIKCKWILIVLTLLALLASADLIANQAGEIFNSARTILPLLARIVLGFHFGHARRQSAPNFTPADILLILSRLIRS